MKANTKRRKPETFKLGNIEVKIYRRDKRHKGKTKDGKPWQRDYRIWEVADFTTGRRVMRQFHDHAKAWKEAEKLAGQIATGQTTAATMTNPQAASYGRATQLLPPGVSLELVAATYAKAYELVGDRIVEAARFLKQHGADNIAHRTVAEVVAELVEVKRARGKSAVYIRDLTNRLDRFAKDFAVDIGSVTTGDVQHWLDKLDVAPQTARNFRTVIGTLFSFAESRGYIFKGGNPVEGVEAIKANGGAIEIYTPGEIAGLLKAASKTFLPVVALGAFAGLRSAEIERLDWQDVDLAGGFIHLGADKTKTRSRRLVPIVTNLSQWLAPYAKQKGRVWKATANDLQDERAEAVAKAKVPWKNNALRHSFISYRLADIQNAAQVALEAGNSPAVVFKHYRELVKPDAAKAWFAIAPEQPGNVVTLKTEAAR